MEESNKGNISLAIIVHNEAQSIERCLQSVLPTEAATFEWEILVINNQSTDNTRAVFEGFKHAHPNLPLRWIENDQNHLGKARRLATELAQYELLAFLDSDCVAPPGWLKKMRDFTLKYSGDPKFFSLGSGNTPPIGKDQFNDALAIAHSSWLGHFNADQAKIHSIFRDVNHLPTCNITFIRSRLQEVGGFSPEFGSVCEDMELSLRAKGLGYRIIYAPALEVTHHHPNSHSSWEKKMFRYGWGQIEVARRHPQHLAGIKALPLAAALICLVFALFQPKVVAVALVLYFVAMFICSLLLCFLRRKLVLTFSVFLILTSTQVFYGAGELWGLIRQLKKLSFSTGPKS